MRLAHTTLYGRLLASDPTYDGRFFFAVRTTGIYCLPSCRAKKPKPENVRFFPTCEAARDAGFRACKKCRPDDYARGADPVLETIETVVAELRAETAARVARLLGLAQDTAGFVRLAKKLGLSRLVAGRESLRLPQYLTPWDALLWAILGQQINLPFAFRLRRALTELAGKSVGDGLFAPPSPADVAALKPAVLAARQFSRQKIRTLLDTARLVATGALDLEKLAAGSATRAERALLDIHGLGPWTVNYVLMRGFGFADCTPYGDTGLTGGLQRLFALDHRPDVDATRRLMLPFSPHRSLATTHLWQLKA